MPDFQPIVRKEKKAMLVYGLGAKSHRLIFSAIFFQVTKADPRPFTEDCHPNLIWAFLKLLRAFFLSIPS